jgi:lipooligosaccharide transport system permease protein
MSGALHVLEHHMLVYRRTWRGGVFTTFLAPVLFLLAMGLGLGTFVNQSAAATLSGVSYLVFLAPGLLASNAMQTAANESMYPIMSGLVWNKTYLLMVSAPLAIRDVVFGQALWLMARLVTTSLAFVLVMVIFGATDLARGLLMVPVAIATGLAFGLPIAAYSATQRRDSVFAALNRFVITPLFIFSGVFFPITQLPPLIQPIAFVTPLWHGVALARAIALGIDDPVLASVNVTVLAVYIGLGVFAAMITFRRRLVQ